MTNEAKLQSKIVKYLNSLRGCVAFPVVVTAGMQRGMPDIICCYQGGFVGFEVKTPAGKISNIQKAQSERIMKALGDYYVVRSVDEVKLVMGEIT